MIRPSTIQLQGAAGQTQEVFMQTERLSAYEAAPAAMRAVQQVEAYIQQCGLEESLIELVKMRASQINGCAYSVRSRAGRT
jgi:alkylhydroperoxidase family enzyme